MSKPFRPMLAADISDQLDKIRFPVYATPKLDGVRALVFPDGVYSRSMKKIPNFHVQLAFGRDDLVGLDGELIVGYPTAKDVYRRTQSAVARVEGEPRVSFYVFDNYNCEEPAQYRNRLRLYTDPGVWGVTGIVRVEARRCDTEAELLLAEAEFLNEGYEGLILRSPDGLYKNGRSTVKEQGMLKLKRFTDGEAEIIGIEEEMHNGNEATTNELGRTERSSHKENLTGKGRMGALIVRDLQTKVEFKIGTGFTADDRVKFYAYLHDSESGKIHFKCVGKVVKYKHFAIGAKDKPRHPTYVGLREGWDL